jgi:hypothetical protein
MNPPWASFGIWTVTCYWLNILNNIKLLILTEFIESMFKFLLQKFGVGLVLITTLTYYLPIFETYDIFKINLVFKL